MEPELHPAQLEQNRAPETSPSTSPSVETAPQTAQGVERSAEQFEQRSDLHAIATDAAATALPQVAPLGAAVPASEPVTTQPVTDDNNPVIAADEDLIEKEWVDKAKKIIVSTKDDPYRREEEVSKLQADYIEKRYGRRIGQIDE